MSTTVAGCGAPVGGYGIDGVDATKEAVIQGVVTGRLRGACSERVRAPARQER